MDAITLNSILLTVSSLLLAVLTAIYVVLTRELLRENKRANASSRELFGRQIQLTLFPHINWTAHIGDDDKILVTIQNLGSVPASDVDVLAIAPYSDSWMPPEKFIELYVEEDSQFKRRLFEHEEGIYGIYDHLVYFSMPQGKQVVFQLHLPAPTDFLLVLLQFRDVVGTNYPRLYMFATEGDSEERRFRLISTDPQNVQPHDRITFDFGRGLDLVTEGNSSLPKYVAEEFEPLWKASIGSGNLKGSHPGIEDRGQWEDL